MSVGFNRPTYIISSKTRQEGTVNSFTHVVNIGDNSQYDSVGIISSTIPKTYYNCNSLNNNNVFTLVENAVDIPIVIPVGDYNTNNLPIVLGSLLTSASANGITYGVSYPDELIEAQTHKLSFTKSGALTTSLKFNLNQDCANLLGFSQDDYTFSGSLLTSVNSIDLNFTQYIIIKSNISFNEGTTNSDNDILCQIPTDNSVAFSNNILYNMISLDDASKKLSNKNSKLFNFSITDDDNELLDLNGHDWSFTIMLWEHNTHDELYIQKERTSQKNILIEEKNVKK